MHAIMTESANHRSESDASACGSNATATGRRRRPTKRACLLRLQRSHVDREAILHIGLRHPLISFIDLLNRDDFHIRRDVVLAREIEHLLSFRDAADWGARQAAAPDN